VTDFQRGGTKLEEEKMLKRTEVEEQGVEKRRRSGEKMEREKKRERSRDGDQAEALADLELALSK
jgi:hypothetical protein